MLGCHVLGALGNFDEIGGKVQGPDLLTEEEPQPLLDRAANDCGDISRGPMNLPLLQDGGSLSAAGRLRVRDIRTTLDLEMIAVKTPAMAVPCDPLISDLICMTD